MEQTQHRERPWLAYGLIVMGVVSRLVPHPPNVTPLMAIALFGGTHLAKRWAVLLPLLIVVISDAVIGWHDTVLWSWGAFFLTGTLAWWVRSRPTPARILSGALIGSGLFFVITNFGVWAVGHLYPRTVAGLWQCYLAALPFFRNSLIGDLVYTAALFGGYACVTSSVTARASAR